MNRRTASGLIALAAICAIGTTGVKAQEFPQGPVTIIVPFGAGGATDILGRVIAKSLGEVLEVPVVVENREGAGGALGSQYVARSAPDGQTLLFHTASVSVYPVTVPDADFDYLRDFEPITLATRAPYVVAVRNDTPADDINEFVAYAQERPGELHQGSPGTGTVTHLAGEYFKQKTGVEMLHIPYAGGAAVLAALRGGEIDFLVDTYLAIQGAVESGEIKALAVGTPDRQVFNEDIPTLAGQGIEDFELFTWFAFSAPKGTPAETVEKLNGAILETLQDPDVIRAVELQGEVVGTSPDELRNQIVQEIDLWTGVAENADLE
ncbi:Bug family tripartite tricarboxylate transporter substrate binding protein [Aliihoeflea sp. PC F10.4]